MHGVIVTIAINQGQYTKICMSVTQSKNIIL